jgi:hypothetical protein
MMFFLVLLLFFLRQIQVSGGKAMAFGRSRARLLSEGWDDDHGMARGIFSRLHGHS